MLLKRAMAFDHVLSHESFPGSSDSDTMDCPCVSREIGGGDPTRLCSMALPGSTVQSGNYSIINPDIEFLYVRIFLSR